jgi:ubiquinone/menaquinone biosynthesis C-methylase UbiE
MDWNVFFEVHKDLPREGPGNAVSTERAVNMISEKLPASPRVLDVGCGPGMQTLDLARLLPDACIEGIDAYPAFVSEARSRAEKAGVDDRVTFNVGDMTRLEFDENTFDLIWSEGAAYIMGIEKALLTWKPLLKSEGSIAFTDAVWIRENPPQEIQRFWSDGYPDMTTVDRREAQASALGYHVIGSFVLPPEAWFDDYYDPMEKRIASLRGRFDTESAQSALDDHQREIDLFRRYQSFYGYGFFVLANG